MFGLIASKYFVGFFFFFCNFSLLQNSDISPNLDQGKQLSRGPFPCRINIYIFLFKLSLEGLTARRRSRLARLGTPRRPCRLEAGPRDVAEGPSIRPADPSLGDKAQISHLRSRAFPHHRPCTPKSAWGANCSQIWGFIFFFPPYINSRENLPDSDHSRAAGRGIALQPASPGA